MEKWSAASYGEQWAAAYDELHVRTLRPPYGDVEGAVELLSALSGEGRVLELGIGSGRIALPLAARGVDVSGVDISPAMVEQLRAKPGGEDLPVVIGDMADVPVEGEFRLIFVVFNSLYALLAQAEQLRCLRNVAAHLTGDGVFVVEAFVPDPARLAQPKRMNVVHVGHDRVMLDVSTVDVVGQIVESQQVELRAGARPELRPIKLRYLWPAELDLMAEVAGLRLRDRWSDWRRSPFGSDSAVHVSVYEKAA